MSKARLIRAIAGQTVISKLEKLKSSGILELIESKVSDVTESDVVQLTALIDARIDVLELLESGGE